MTDDLFRVYYDPAEIMRVPNHRYEGYPFAWFDQTVAAVQNGQPGDGPILNDPIKDIVRDQAGHRCVRCLHPFVVGSTPGPWSPCDERCTHGEPIRYREIMRGDVTWTEHRGGMGPSGESMFDFDQDQRRVQRYEHEAEWRVLTVHHLNGIKVDCRWWNLVALCQRCHLTIQAKVHMQRRWRREHTDWFKPYVAGFYAHEFLGQELTRAEVMLRLDGLLALEDRQLDLGMFP